MKVSLWKDIRKYSKTKGKVPLDERQLEAQRDIYIELAKSVILGFMLCIVAFEYMHMYGNETSYNFGTIGVCSLGTITYYYMLRFCYCNVIGLDSTFEMVLVPALLFAPFTLFYTSAIVIEALQLPTFNYLIAAAFFPLYFFIFYMGANKVYNNGLAQLEKEMLQEEQHFHSRKMLVINFIVIGIIAFMLPIPYDTVFSIGIILSAIFNLYSIYRFGFTTPSNDYILNNEGLSYHKALWGKKGRFVPYEDILDVSLQDTFNIGYAKDKVKIVCKDGSHIYLFPENSFRFCTELKNNL